jgi:hypothetical protein
MNNKKALKIISSLAKRYCPHRHCDKCIFNDHTDNEMCPLQIVEETAKSNMRKNL